MRQRPTRLDPSHNRGQNLGRDFGQNPRKILFVCLGNICRSPAADGIARRLTAQSGLNWTIDSAGTGAWHVGSQPDDRMITAAARRGVDLTLLRARQAVSADFHAFDHVFAMDRSNFADLQQIRPHDGLAELHLFLRNGDVPDPYYGGDDGFELVLDMIQSRIETLFSELSGK